MNNQFEGHQPNPTPRIEAQFEEINQDKLSVLLDEAQAKAEAFILYAPIEKKFKEPLSEKLSDATEQEMFDFKTLLRRGGISAEEAASTIFQRRLRAVVVSMQQELKPLDYQMLSKGVEKLIRTDRDSFDDIYEAWMKGGLNE